MAIDPVTAVGLGAGILQFVQFASKILSVSREIQDTVAGSALENNELEAITRNLISLSEKLTVTDGDSSKPLKALSNSERNIMSMSSLCQEVASELLDALEKLKLQGRRTKFTSTVQALKTVWSKGKLDNLRLRLEQCRNGIHTALLVSLTDKIDQITPEVLRDLQSGTAIEKIKMDTLKAVRDSKAGFAETDDIAIQREAESEMRATLARNLSRLTQQERNDFLRSQILEHLRFDDQEERESRIQQAHAKTFHWIWRDASAYGDMPWSNFVTWLEEDGDPLYWITGKPGSGKSTLMKYIVHDLRCERLLKQWAGQMPLVITKFYLWNSGSRIQMSQEGLLRSVLYDALQQMPTLVSKVFPQRWENIQFYGSDLCRLDSSELYQAFESLVMGATAIKICLFVDGLDEFDGDPQQLVELFHMAISHPNVKVCLSSRPWAVFEEAFNRRPSLRLEDITYPDILAFITSIFEHNSGFVTLKRREPEFACTLTENIAKKSRGVFLWVTLVVKSLLNGLSNYDRVSDLQRRLDDLPDDLEQFYRKIFASIDSFYLTRSSQLFELLDASQGNLTAIGLSFADEEDSNAIQMALDCHIAPLTGQEIKDRYEQVKRRLVSYCKGLLEIPDFKYQYEEEPGLRCEHMRPRRKTPMVNINRSISRCIAPVDSKERSSPSRVLGPKPLRTPPHLRKVAYIHRTARDFLKSPPIKRKIAERAGAFNSSIPLLSSAILMIKTWDSTTQGFNPLAELGKCAMKYAATAAKSSALEHKLLDEMDRSMEAHCNTSPEWYKAHSASLVYWQSACTDSGSARGPKTFLELASMYELRSYLSSKIQQNFPVFSDQNTIPLLYRIISQYSEYPSFQDPVLSDHRIAAPNTELVEYLFRNGSDPNSRIGIDTIWGAILQESIKVSKHQYHWCTKDVETRLIPILQSWVHIVEVAIKYGANPLMNTNSQQSNCIREAFGRLLPSQASRLDKLNSRTGKRWPKLLKFITPTPKDPVGKTHDNPISTTVDNIQQRAAKLHAELLGSTGSPKEESDRE